MSWLSGLATVLQVVGAIVGYFFPPIGLALMAAGSLLGSYDARREAKRAARRQRDAFNASLQDRLETIQAETAARRVILGKRRVGGVIAFAGTTGANKEKLYLVILLAGHRVQSIDTVYFGETALTLDGSGNVTTSPYTTSAPVNAQSYGTAAGDGTATIALANTPISGSIIVSWKRSSDRASGFISTWTLFSNLVSITGAPAGVALTVNYQYNTGATYARIYKFDGTQTSVPTVLSAAFPTQWTAAQKLLGQAFLVAELTYNTDVFSSGIPNISAVVQGALVYDPRSSTTAFSENPALLLAHFATHPLGGRLPWSAIDTATLTEAANQCDSTTTMYYTTDSVGNITGSGPQTLFKAAMVVDGSSRPADVLDELAESMGGRWAISNGKLMMRAAMLRSTADTITIDYLAGGTTIKAQRSRQELANTVRGTYSSDQANWNTTQFTQVQDATLLAAHGAELVMETQYEAVGRGPQCQYLATVALREMRQAMVVTLNCNMRAYPLQVFDIVAVTLDRYGWAAKLFEIVERAWTPEGIRLTLRETAAAIYDQTMTFATADIAPNGSLPNPADAVGIVSLSATSGVATLQQQSDGTVTPRVLLTWSLVGLEAVRYGSIEIKYGEAAADESTWTTVVVPGGDTQAYITSSILEGQTYIFKARAKTRLTTGPWCTHLPHRVAAYGLNGASPAYWQNGSGVASVWINASAVSIYWAQGDSSSYTLPPGSVGNTQLQSGAVDAGSIANEAVNSAKLKSGAATDVLSVVVASQSVLSTTAVNVAFLSYTPDVDCIIQVSLSCNAVMNTNGAEQWGAYGGLSTTNFAGTAIGVSASTLMVRNPDTSISRDEKPVSRIINIAGSAGVPVTVYFWGISELGPAGTRAASVSNAVMRLEAIKR